MTPPFPIIDAASLAVLPPMRYPVGRMPARWGSGARVPGVKEFKSYDLFSNPDATIYIIRRESPKKPVGTREMPRNGERVIINGKLVVVARADIVGDSEFHWWPDIAITVKENT